MPAAATKPDSTAKEYIVLCAQIVGSDRFETVYAFDGKSFPTREQAIAHGFTKDRSDDFNIGVLEFGKLVSLDWMQEPIGEDPDVIAQIADQVGLAS